MGLSVVLLFFVFPFIPFEREFFVHVRKICFRKVNWWVRKVLLENCLSISSLSKKLVV